MIILLMQKLGWIVIGVFVAVFPLYVFGITVEKTEGNEKIISYGKDLTPEEKILVFREFPLPETTKPAEIKSVEVTNEEEWKLFKGIIPDAEIGTKAISSIYVEKLDSGQGIQVDTKNITLITPQMFANALVTAGVKDAKIYATAPNPVSGTAALTGIYKSYESLSGKNLDDTAKQVAAKELVQTGDLGEKIGKERAALLVERSKERVVSERAVNPEQIQKIIDDSAQEQNITLTDSQKKELTDLLLKVKELNINLDQLKTQLKNFQVPVEKETVEKPQSWIDKFISFLQSIIDQIFSFVGRIFGMKK